MSESFITLRCDENQARGLGQYAIDFLAGRFAPPGREALERIEQFHLDSVACGVSALACGARAPRVLRSEALEYRTAAGSPSGVFCFGSRVAVKPEKAVLANSSAVREWDANGTNFGYNPARGATRGEFGHNDFYPVAIAGAQLRGHDGPMALRAMLLVDEIRGRLAEVFALKDYKIDHVVHGAIASAATYGALLSATAEQIESAIGLVVAHYIPFRAIRAGKQLSDSKGASAPLSAEMAVTSVQRALRGFVGPADIFRNPEAIFCLFEPPAEKGTSPFDLTLATSGNDFAILGMHFKLGLYEHQSAGAIEGLISLLTREPALLADAEALERIRIVTYQPAFGIIGDPAKRDPRTRQSADHSMVYIVATLLRKAIKSRTAGWSELMLVPADYDDAALHDPLTRRLMDRIEFSHGGPEYDAKYPDGIPTTLEIVHRTLGTLSSGLVMYPEGHARNTSGNLKSLLEAKFSAGLPAKEWPTSTNFIAAFHTSRRRALPRSPRSTIFRFLACPILPRISPTMSAAPASPPGSTPPASPKPVPVAATTPAAPTSAHPLPAQRLVSLDAYRGLTMFAMASNGIGLLAVASNFRESPGWQKLAYQLDHVPWVGCAVWDMIQPSFMFIVGVAMIFSLTSRQARGQSWGRTALHAAWRSIVLILLGIFLRSSGTPITNFMFEDVLTQIGLGYFFLFLLWNRPPAVQLGAALALLVGDWLMFYVYPAPGADFDYSQFNFPPNWQHLTGIEAHWDMNTNVANAFDQWWMNLFPRPDGKPYIQSPGGYQTLNFIPSLATMIFGLLAGRLLQGGQSPWRKFGWLVLAGLVSLGLGWGLAQSGLCPLVKRIWTPSWTLFSTGWVLLTLAGFYAVVDILGLRRWTFPFVVVGMNSILIYVMAELMPGWFSGRLRTHFGERFSTLWGLVPGEYSPLVNGIAVLTIMWLVCYWCYRQKVFIRI